MNTASRMESTGEAGKIQVAPATRELLGERFAFEERGVVDVRGNAITPDRLSTAERLPLAAIGGGETHLHARFGSSGEDQSDLPSLVCSG